MPTEQEIEAEIKAKGKTAPRLTPELIDAVIVGEDYHMFPGTTTTVCRLALRNGYSVIGSSAAVSLENFDEEIGRKVARENARREIWALEGYRLKEWLWVKNLEAPPEAAPTPEVATETTPQN